MPVSQTLRDCVTARLNAAAEDILALFEGTIVKYEEELWRKQQLLDQIHIPSANPVSGLNQFSTQTVIIKKELEEQSMKEEEEQMPVSDSIGFCGMTAESSLLQQRQTQTREETQGADISPETQFLFETETGHPEHSTDTDNDDQWPPSFSCSATQMETEAVRDQNNQVEMRDRSRTAQSSSLSFKHMPFNVWTSPPPETRLSNHGDLSGPEGTEGRKHQCSFCGKRFCSNKDLQIHNRVHTGERPYSCPVCGKAFSQKCNLNTHMRTHTNQKPFTCSICNKTFTHKSSLEVHTRIHTGDKPFGCSLCSREFKQSSHLRTHMRKQHSDKPELD